MSLSCTVSEIGRQRGIGRKSQILIYPTFIWRLRWGNLTPLEFRRDLWCQKTRVPGLSYGVVCVILCLGVLINTGV